MKNTKKITLTVLSILAYLIVAFFAGVYYVGGLSHLYYSQNVVHRVYGFFAIAILVLMILIALIILMFKCKKIIRIICALLLIAFLPAAFYGCLVEMVVLTIQDANGCSYTEDVAHYGRYDQEYNIPYFPESITEDMTVVQFAYFYKYIDIDQTDIYLEVKFEDQETMDLYLTTAKNSLSETGILTYQNPYDPKYTDIIPNQWVEYSSQSGSLSAVIRFSNFDDYRYVEMYYQSITYSYDELTIIYNYTDIGSDIEVGNNPDGGEYYPKYLERFGVKWNPDHNFTYEYVEE